MYSAKILADSIHNDNRLTTFEIVFPRFVLAEFNTHRVFSRNSASSRAIPVEKAIKMVIDDPFIPEEFGQNIPGMGWNEAMAGEDDIAARAIWEAATNSAIFYAGQLNNLGVHKALANRILEPFKWHTVIVSATEWSNFFALRTDKNAQPEIRKIALMMQELYTEHEPYSVDPQNTGAPFWHLPLVTNTELYRVPAPDNHPYIPDWDYWKKVSVGRCARISYLTHDGVRDPTKDIELHDRLMTNGHLSPFEHQATPWPFYTQNSGNFRGWRQYRSYIPYQDDFAEAQRHRAT